jgi:hypothetical protein
MGEDNLQCSDCGKWSEGAQLIPICTPLSQTVAFPLMGYLKLPAASGRGISTAGNFTKSVFVRLPHRKRRGIRSLFQFMSHRV